MLFSLLWMKVCCWFKDIQNISNFDTYLQVEFDLFLFVFSVCVVSFFKIVFLFDLLRKFVFKDCIFSLTIYWSETLCYVKILLIFSTVHYLNFTFRIKPYYFKLSYYPFCTSKIPKTIHYLLPIFFSSENTVDHFRIFSLVYVLSPFLFPFCSFLVPTKQQKPQLKPRVFCPACLLQILR